MDNGVPLTGRAVAASQSSQQAVSPVPASIANAFAERWWEFIAEKSLWTDEFCDLLTEDQDYDRLGTDDYDASLEIHGATDDWRLDERQQRFLFGAGFATIYVNHKDGWETHYSARGKDLPVAGWRRRYVSDLSGPGDRVIVGDPDPGYWEISHWPESWNTERMLAERESGYYRIVPDPVASAMSARGGQDAKRLGAKPASAVPKADAQPQPESSYD